MEPAVAVAIVTGLFGLLGIIITVLRSSKVDTALDATKTIELSVKTQQDIINTLREELSRQTTSNSQCLNECAALRKENIELTDSHEAMRLALNATRSVVAEHEETISRLQRQITALRNRLQ